MTGFVVQGHIAAILTGHLVMSSGHSWGATEAGSTHVLSKTQCSLVFEMTLSTEVWSTAVFPHLGSWWHTEPYSRFFPSSWGVLGCWGHFTHTAKVLWNRKRKTSMVWQLLSQVNKRITSSVCGSCTYRAFLLWGLQTARAVVAHAASWISLQLSLCFNQFVYLVILPHTRREFGSQMNQFFLIRRGQWRWLILCYHFTQWFILNELCRKMKCFNIIRVSLLRTEVTSEKAFKRLGSVFENSFLCSQRLHFCFIRKKIWKMNIVKYYYHVKSLFSCDGKVVFSASLLQS